MTDLVKLVKSIVSATAVKVLDDKYAVNTIRDAIVRDIAGFDTGEAFTVLESVEFRASVSPLAVEQGRALDKENQIWSHNCFVLPHIATLAKLFDRCLDPLGEGRFGIELREVEKSLAGYELVHITPTDARSFEIDVFALMVAGASKSFLTDPAGRELAKWALPKILTK